MKKLTALLLAFILMLSLFACGGDAPSQPDTQVPEDTTVIPSDDTTAPSDDTTAPAVDTTTAADIEEPQEMDHTLYEHVIVIGVDGAGQFLRDAETPNFDRIFENGSVTYRAFASYPSGSGQCWGSILTGTAPSVHGLTNAIAENEPYPSDSPYPTLFKRIANAIEGARLGLYCTWCPILDGMQERDIEVTHRWECYDEDTAERAATFVRKVKPTFMFVQFDSADAYGHNNGYGSPEHLERLKLIDTYIGEIYDNVVEGGILDSTLFIIVADHGGTYDRENHVGGHGGWSDEEKYITFAVAGKTVKPGEMGEAHGRDVAAIVLYALGIEAPTFSADGWSAQVPTDLFNENDIRKYNSSIYTEDGNDAQ